MRKTFIAGFLLLMSSICVAQSDSIPSNKRPLWKDKIFMGGGFDAQFWGDIAMIYLSPEIGYRFTDKIVGGAGVTYVYFQDKFYDYDTHVYGSRGFGRYFVMENIFLHSELEVMSLEATSQKDLSFKRRTTAGFLIGGGVMYPIGGNSFASILLLWDLIEDEFYPYSNPVFRIGFGLGF